MDVASGPHYQHDREGRTAGVQTGAKIALALLIIAGLCLLAILATAIASLPPAPESEPVLLAPLRWYSSVRWYG
jgi:hypothetical protein